MENSYQVREQVYASQGKRFANFIIDRIIFVIAAVAFFAGVAIVLSLLGLHEWAYALENINPILDYIISGLLYVGYFILLEGYFQKSLGKMITKTVVVNINGEKPNMGTIVKRSFCRLIPFEPFSYLSSDAYGWHDSISKTFVVDEKLFEEKKRLFHDLNELGSEEVSSLS